MSDTVSKLTGFSPVTFVGTVEEIWDTDRDGNQLVVGQGRNKGKPYVRVLVRASDLRNQTTIITIWDPEKAPEVGQFGVFNLRVNRDRVNFESFSEADPADYVDMTVA